MSDRQQPKASAMARDRIPHGMRRAARAGVNRTSIRG